MNNNQLSKFNFFIPLNIEKGGVDGQLVKISGVASTDAKDSDGETLIPAGFDFAPLLQSGFLNWNHQAKSTSKAICGEPTAAKIINDGKDFFIEGVLYPNEEGRNVVELAETLQKHSPNRRLGFSIEGQALERDILNPKRVTKARITGVAITQSPKNPNTLMNIVKGEYDSEFIDSSIELGEIQKSNQEPVVMRISCSPSGAAQLGLILELLKHNGEVGHSLTVDVDCDSTMEEGRKKIGWDGDGSDRIFSIDSGQELDKSTEVEEGAEQPQLDKAMTVNIDLNPPSVEGTDEGKKLFSGLKKSEIYNQIHSRYTDSFEKAEQIYEFVNQVKERSMKTKDITPDVLEKAFNILDESIALSKGGDQKSEKDYDTKDEVFDKKEDGDDSNKNIEKSDDTKDDDKSNDDAKDKEKDEEEEDDDDFAKAMNCESIAKSFLEKGMAPDEVVKSMTDLGISLTLAETSCNNCIAQANAEKEGGNVTVLKGEKDELNKSEESTLGEAILAKIDQKFQAMGTIMKSQVEKIDSLEKSNKDISSEFEKFKSQPNERKSAGTVKAVERFEKSADGKTSLEVYDSRNIGDMKALSTRLFGEVELLKSQGHEDRGLEKAVADLEIAKSTNFTVIGPRLRAMGIEVR